MISVTSVCTMGISALGKDWDNNNVFCSVLPAGHDSSLATHSNEQKIANGSMEHKTTVARLPRHASKINIFARLWTPCHKHN